MRALAALLLLARPTAAWADSHTVAIVNGGSATIREIHIAPAGSGLGANRLRSTLPPHATADITYSTGCRATVTLNLDDGRSESFADQDVCAGLRIVSGQGAGSIGVAETGHTAKSKTAAVLPAFQPAHINVPWTGRSITHKFGGLN